MLRLLGRLNAARSLPSHPDLALLESVADDLFSVSQRLAVYGSLAPGRSNHFVIEGLDGHWTAGFVQGELHEPVPGKGRRFPALVWDPDGSRIDVMVLTSPDLPGAWPRLDRFEGPAYRRTVVPVEDPSGAVIVANIYELEVKD